MDAGADPLLHALADRPVLAIDEIPELSGVTRVEVALADLERLEQEMTGEARERRAMGLQDEDRGVIARETHEQIRVHQLTLVAYPLFRTQCWNRAAPGRTAGSEGVGTRTMRDALRPVEIGAAALAEGRHHCAQLRIHPAAVVALVVVFAQHLPVGSHLVTDGVSDPQLLEPIALDALREAAEVLRERGGRGPGAIMGHAA